MKSRVRVTAWIIILLAVFVTVLPLRAQVASDLLARVNQLRASLGRAPFTVNAALTAAAQQQAQWVVDTGNVSHTRPDGSGPRSRALANGYASTQVNENIYGGTMATVNDAWNFWMNDGIHYAGMTDPNYTEIGIGAASGAWGSAFVMVFGNPGGPPPYVPPPSGAGNTAGQAAAPPSYVVGTDEHGNIEHRVQSGDTLGDIALIYGYTWADLPYMMELNGLTDVRDLEIGSIFLVPPKDGTFTPTPTDSAPAEPTSTLVPDTPEPTATPSATPSSTLTETPLHIATAASPPEFIGLPMAADAVPENQGKITEESTPLVVAAAPTRPGEVAVTPGVTITRGGQSPWIAIALIVQVVVVGIAAFEFFRRAKKRRP